MDNARERVLDVLEKHARNSGLVAWAGLNGSPLIADLTALLDTVAAEARAGMKEQAARIPEQQARNLEDVVRSNVVGADQVDQLWIDRLREEHEEFCKVADAIRALQPDPALVVIARADLAKLCDVAEGAIRWMNVINSIPSAVLRDLRAALDRVRGGEG